MNSQFKNSSLGTYIYAFLILVMTAAVIFIFWYMYSGYKMGTYAEDTVLGSVYVGGLREDDIEPLLETRINRWLGDESVVFEATYQGYSYEFDRELFVFNVNSSKTKITDGIINKLDVTYQNGIRDEIILDIKQSNFMSSIKHNVDYDLLVTHILNDASFMKSFSSKEIEDYIIDESESFIPLAITDLTVPVGFNIDDLISKVSSNYESGNIELPDKYLFDVIKELGEDLDDSELTLLSLALYDIILDTNFSIDEVHYENNIPNGYDLDTFPYFGNNVKIFERSNESFTFYNPNDGHYYFEVTKVPDKDDELRVVLYGLPFVDDIDIFETFVTIDRAEITLDEGVEKEGIDGIEYKVQRVITNLDGIITYDNYIVTEFYPPKVKIIIDTN